MAYGNPITNPFGIGNSNYGGYDPFASPNYDPQLMQKQQQQKDVANIQGGYSTQAARIGAEPALMNAQFARDKFNTVFPWVQGQTSNLMSQLGGAAGGGSDASAGPSIRTGGVWNPQQISQQVNAMRSHNDQATATQNNQARNNLGGMGFGSHSPLLQALYGQNNAANLQTNASQEEALRTGTAQQNAQQQLASQSAAANVYAQRQAEALQRRGQTLNAFTSLIGGLSGLV